MQLSYSMPLVDRLSIGLVDLYSNSAEEAFTSGSVVVLRLNGTNGTHTLLLREEPADPAAVFLRTCLTRFYRTNVVSRPITWVRNAGETTKGCWRDVLDAVKDNAGSGEIDPVPTVLRRPAETLPCRNPLYSGKSIDRISWRRYTCIEAILENRDTDAVISRSTSRRSHRFQREREREREREGGENTWKEAAETNFQRNFVDSSARPDELSFGFTKLSFRRVIVSAVEPSDSSGWFVEVTLQKFGLENAANLKTDYLWYARHGRSSIQRPDSVESLAESTEQRRGRVLRFS